MEILSASIDLTKIDKKRIKEGKKGQKYYDITIMIFDEKNQYGQDIAVIEGQTKEEREANKEKNYLGNGKTIYSKKTDVPDEEIAEVKPMKKQDDDQLPF